jgi:murein DD-endopeptidase MepM/ murein hydrolase activator NlpD
MPRVDYRCGLGIVGIQAVTVIALAAPVEALQVKVTPPNPKLGDTLQVMVQYDDPQISVPPQVMLGNQTYPTFLLRTNQFRALLPTTPLSKPGLLNLQVMGAGETEAITVRLGARKFPTQSIWLSGKGSTGTDYEFDRVDAFKKLVTPQKFWSGKFLRPSRGPITSGYGVRRYYNGVFAKDYFHRGIDYAGANGSPVTAAATGRVALVGRVGQGFKLHGNTIGLDHGQGVTTIYLHLSRIHVKEGNWVKPGQVIGAVGSTGASTGPHLHWGLYVNGLSVDPAPWRDRGFD